MNATDLDRLANETAGGEPAGSPTLANEVRLLRDEVRRLRGALSAPPRVPEPASQDWSERLPKQPAEQYATRTRADIQRLVIHHSAVPAEVGAEQIARFQVERRGWPGFGYHYFIQADGTLLKTNSPETVCFHAGADSERSLGICLAGRFDEVGPPLAQLETAAALCAHWCGLLGLHASLGGVLGHSDLMGVHCPGPQWGGGVRWRDRLLEQIRRIQDVQRRREGRSIGHYLLFWENGAEWDAAAWQAAQTYIGRFRPICGCSIEAARHADFVTLVGDERRFSAEVEAYLREAGCVVERIDERDSDTLRALFEKLVEDERRFLGFEL